METKIFGNKEIKIREITAKDLKNVKKFQDFINSLVEENAMIQADKKKTLKEETEWLKENLKMIKNHRRVDLIAEDKGKIVGKTDIKLGWGKITHVGHFGITIRSGYRKMGLGTYLTKKILVSAKKELKPAPKIIRLSVFSINKEAISFYRKLGFKEVASIPKQIKFKGRFVDEMIMLLELK